MDRSLEEIYDRGIYALDALRDEANALNIARDYWDRQIRGVRNSTSWKLTSKLRNMRNRGNND